jgi:hypothetical protein
MSNMGSLVTWSVAAAAQLDPQPQTLHKRSSAPVATISSDKCVLADVNVWSPGQLLLLLE